MGESKFDKLANKIAKEYRKDGDSAEKAKEIGEATAAKIGFAKYGKRGMERKARAGRDAESFSAECVCGITCVCDCGCAESGVCDCGPSCPCSCGCGVEIETQDAESFEAPPSSRESKVARAMKTRSSGKSRGKKKGPFVFPARKAYPIGDMSHAKRALVFSTWPDNKRDAKKVRDAVFKRYPKLRNWFKDGKYAKHAESFDAEIETCYYCENRGHDSGGLCTNCNKSWFGPNRKTILGNLGAESFDAEVNYIVAERPHHIARIRDNMIGGGEHGLEQFNRPGGIHSEQNKLGMIYDEEIANWRKMNKEEKTLFNRMKKEDKFDAESFDASEGLEGTWASRREQAVYVLAQRPHHIARVRQEVIDRGENPEWNQPNYHTTYNEQGLIWDDEIGGTRKMNKEEKTLFNRMKEESFDAEKIEGQTQSNIYAKFFVGHVSKDELRGNGKFKTYDSALKKAKEVAKREGNSRVVSPMGAALWTSNDKGLFQVGHLTKEAKRFYNSEEEMATGYLSAESTIYDAPMGVHDEYCIMQGRYCMGDRLPGKTLCANCEIEFGEMFPKDAEYTALGVPARRMRATEIMSPSMRALRDIFLIGGAILILSTAGAQAGPKGESNPIASPESSHWED
jgi:hypothetical protein